MFTQEMELAQFDARQPRNELGEETVLIRYG